MIRILFIWLISFSSYATDYFDALNSADGQSSWINITKQFAMKDDPDALYALSLFYSDKDNSYNNKSLAKQYLARAARTGSLDAKYDLLMAMGLKNAAKDLKPLATEGLASAQYSYAKALIAGIGIKRDLVEGKYWLETSVSQGYKPAKLLLANYLSSGTVFELDPARALVLKK